MRAPNDEFPIRLDRVSVTVHGKPILDEVSLIITSGEPTVLIGPNGSGKTTLLRLLMGLVQPTLGNMWHGGRKIIGPQRRAIVFQRPAMLRRSAAGNILYALAAAGVDRSEHDARCVELLALVGLSALASVPAKKLSGGEQQRLAIARALAKDPDLLLLDEPTASLDPAATKMIEDMIRDITARGIKVVMATHDLGEARRLAGDIVLLHRGRIAEAGTAEDFFTFARTREAKKFIGGELLV